MLPILYPLGCGPPPRTGFIGRQPWPHGAHMLPVSDEFIAEELVQGPLLLADTGDIEPEVEDHEGR